MKIITLKTGEKVKVDDRDFEYLSQFPWRRQINKSTHHKHIYVVYTDNSKRAQGGKVELIYMHRLLMKAKKGQDVDHKDRDSLNNQKSNLRKCTRSQNLANSKHHYKTKYLKGVRKSNNKFSAVLKKGKHSYYGGVFPTEIEAAKKYDEMAIFHFGEFASLNFSQ